jgi:outer membrane protein TolC
MGINLFQGGITRAELKKNESQRLRLVEEKNKLIDDIKLEVEKYLLNVGTAKERVEVTKDSVQQAEENLRINRVKYEEGAGTATDVLDAVTLLIVAETNNYKSVYDLRRAEAAVLYAIGTDLSEVYK